MHRILSVILLPFLLLASALAGCADRSASQVGRGQAGEAELVITIASEDPLVGEWEFDDPGSAKHVSVLLRRSDGSREYLSAIDRGRLNPTADGYRVASPVATLDLRVDPSHDETGGPLALTPASDLDERYPRITGELTRYDLLRLNLVGIDDAYLTTLTENGHSVSWDQVAQLRTRGVGAAYVRAIRKARATPMPPTVPVEPDARELTAIPPPRTMPAFSTDDIIYLSTRGVPAEYITALQQAGYGFDVEKIYYLRSRGVPAEYADELRAAGYDLSAKDLYYLRSRGVPAEFAAEVRAMGYDLSPERLYYLRSRGVPSSYIAALRDAGYHLSPEQVYYLRSRGVPAEYAAAMAEAHHEPLTPEQLYHLRSRGVDPALVRALRSTTPTQ